MPSTSGRRSPTPTQVTNLRDIMAEQQHQSQAEMPVVDAVSEASQGRQRIRPRTQRANAVQPPVRGTGGMQGGDLLGNAHARHGRNNNSAHAHTQRTVTPLMSIRFPQDAHPTPFYPQPTRPGPRGAPHTTHHDPLARAYRHWLWIIHQCPPFQRAQQLLELNTELFGTYYG